MSDTDYIRRLHDTWVSNAMDYAIQLVAIQKNKNQARLREKDWKIQVDEVLDKLVFIWEKTHTSK